MACIRRRGGKWVIDFYDQAGIRRRETVKGIREDAERRLTEIQSLVGIGLYLSRKDIPDFETVAQDWLDAKGLNVRHTSLNQYTGHVKNHLNPFFGQIPINKISLALMEKFVRKHLKEGPSVALTRKVLTTLYSIMKYAIRHKYINYNPVIDLERPKERKVDKRKDIRPKFLTVAQIQGLLKHSDKYRTFFMTAVLSGMRLGELLGLKWKDFIWKNNQVHVQRTYNHGKFYFPKSKNSDRYIDLAPHLILELKKWQLACPPGDLKLVFPRGAFWGHKPEGKLERIRAGWPTEKSYMWRHGFSPALKRAKLPGVTFHSLRHTFASLLIAQGENPKYIMKQMGHSSISVTFDLYGHLMEETNAKAAEQLGDTVLGTLF